MTRPCPSAADRSPLGAPQALVSLTVLVSSGKSSGSSLRCLGLLLEPASREDATHVTELDAFVWLEAEPCRDAPLADHHVPVAAGPCLLVQRRCAPLGWCDGRNGRREAEAEASITAGGGAHIVPPMIMDATIAISVSMSTHAAEKRQPSVRQHAHAERAKDEVALRIHLVHSIVHRPILPPERLPAPPHGDKRDHGNADKVHAQIELVAKK